MQYLGRSNGAGDYKAPSLSHLNIMPYNIEIIGPEESRELFARYEGRYLYTAENASCMGPASGC